MRISGAKKVHYDSGPNMTPLVDVVMVILIFLMLAGSFGGVEQYLESKLPPRKDASGGLPTPPSAFDDVQVDIRVDGHQGENTWLATMGGTGYRTTEELRAALVAKFTQYQNQGTSKEKLQVIINPNRYVKWKSLIMVYQTALLAGYEKIAFSQAH